VGCGSRKRKGYPAANSAPELRGLRGNGGNLLRGRA